MASYDLVSALDMGELKNVINMAQKQIAGRYDFKGSDTSLNLKDTILEIQSDDEYKVNAALDIFRTNMAKRNMGMKSIEVGEVQPSGNRRFKLVLTLSSGIDKETGKKINKIIKDSGMKLSSQYLDEKVRVTGKKIDDLQELYTLLKGHDDVKVDLQMQNMKR